MDANQSDCNSAIAGMESNLEREKNNEKEILHSWMSYSFEQVTHKYSTQRGSDEQELDHAYLSLMLDSRSLRTSKRCALY